MTIARVRTIFTGVAGTPWYSNLYFFDNGGTEIGPDAVTWVTAFWTSLSAVMQDSVIWTIEPEVARLDESTGQLTGVTATPGATGGGTQQVAALPWQTQGLIREFTGAFVNGRRVRGRTFIPGPTESSSDVGVPIGTYITALQNAADALIASSVSTWCVWARPFDGDPAAVPPKPARTGTAHIIVSANVWDKWAVQRSRRD